MIDFFFRPCHAVARWPRFNKMIIGRVIKRAQSRGCCTATRFALRVHAMRSARCSAHHRQNKLPVFTESEKINPLNLGTTTRYGLLASNCRRCFCQTIRVDTQFANDRTREM